MTSQGRPVQYSPHSVAELFLRGFITDEDILPGGTITNSTRIRAERTYAESSRLCERPRPPSGSTERRFEGRETFSDVERPRVQRSYEEDEETSLDHCCICLYRTKEYACVPCGHMCICITCKERVQSCPICRSSVQKIVKIFL